MKIKNNQYIAAIDQVAEISGGLEDFISELEALNSNPSALRFFLDNPRSNLEEKKAFLTTNNVSLPVINLLFLLKENRSLDHLATIIQGLKEKQRQKEQMIEVKIKTSQAISTEEQNSLRERLAKKLGQKVVLAVETDPGLIGGIKITMGNQLIDGSVKARLAEMERELIKNF